MFKLNSKQQEAFDAVKSGKNILLTGPAGTGKSYSLECCIKWARSTKKEVGITASTGLSAYLIKGRTIHSFLGIGLGKKPAEVLADQVRKKSPMVYNRLKGLDILIIDEVSMLDMELLDKISDYLSIIRKDSSAFGGMQIVLCADFCQLPPVEGEFCFLSKVWKKADINMIVLDELVRQSKDTEFQKMLQELRWGTCTKETLKILKGLKSTAFPEGIIPTKLYSVNKDVDRINLEEYAKLVEAGAARVVFKTKYSSHPSTEQWSKSIKIHEEVELCIGAQVMVTWNIPAPNDPQGYQTIVNGTRGVVTKINNNYVVIRLVCGKEVEIEYLKLTCEDNDKMVTSFMPLKLAYAMSIHKSQGCTLDALEVDLGDSIFEYGQAYVALSRARTLSSVRVISVKSSSFKTHPLVKKFYGV